MNWGIPYMGSKSKIIHLIRYILERHFDKKYFIDVFCGGFAVSHYVLEKTDFRLIANDKNKYVVALIKKALKGELPPLCYEFVDRDKFFDVKDNPEKYDDWYVGFVLVNYSFGNSGTTYLFGREIEKDKQHLHDAIVFNKWDGIMQQYESVIPLNVREINYFKNRNKRVSFMNSLKKNIKMDANSKIISRIQNLERLQQMSQIERTEQLQRVERTEQLQRVERIETLDWKDFIKSVPEEVLKNAIIYCDPPYEDTAKYMVNSFDINEFWQWFRETPYCVYVSSYKAPDDIKALNFDYKMQTLSGQGSGKKVTENIYWNGKGSPTPTLEDMLFNQNNEVHEC